MGLIKSVAPSLPIPTTTYSQDQQQQLGKSLRLYFNQIDTAYWDGTKVVNPYGAWQSSATQTTTADTATVMSMNITDYEYGTNIVSSTKMTVKYSGIYNLQWSGQFQNTDNAQHDISVWIRQNDADVSGSTGFISIPARKSVGAGNEGHVVVGWNYFLQLAASDYIELWWSTTNAAVTLEYYAAGTSPTRPATASLIATLSFVSAIP
jgi:hypothetical protein